MREKAQNQFHIAALEFLRGRKNETWRNLVIIYCHILRGDLRVILFSLEGSVCVLFFEGDPV